MADRGSGKMEGVFASFFYHPIFGHCVSKTIEGDKMHTSVESRITQADVEIWPVAFERYMSAYRADLSKGGTPLTAIPGMDPNHAGLYSLQGVTTVEDLVTLNDTMVNALPGNGKVLRDVARIMMQNQQLTGAMAPMPDFDAVPLPTPVARDAMIIDPPPDVIKRGPGRPPKVRVTETTIESDDPMVAEALANG